MRFIFDYNQLQYGIAQNRVLDKVLAFVHNFHIDIDFLCEHLSNNRQHNVLGVSVFSSVAEISERK